MTGPASATSGTGSTRPAAYPQALTDEEIDEILALQVRPLGHCCICICLNECSCCELSGLIHLPFVDTC